MRGWRSYHQLLTASMWHVLPRIPCIRVQHLTGVEQRLLRIAFNRLGENGAWNLEDLKIEFEELIVEQTPIEISGFSAPEIDQILLGDDPPPHEQGPLAPAPGALAVARDNKAVSYDPKAAALVFDQSGAQNPIAALDGGLSCAYLDAESDRRCLARCAMLGAGPAPARPSS
jgi:hypothetical protein